VSPAEKLLKLCLEYHETSDDDPAKIDRLERYKKALYTSSTNGDFNDQMPHECLQQFIEEKWRRGQRPPEE
jgi:hypothetical protein